MLKLTIQKQTVYDEKENRFYDVPETIVELEHSLLAISKWESKWHIPFLKKEERTRDQIIYYVYCMCLNEDMPLEWFCGLTNTQFKEISEYIDNPMTATTITNHEKKSKAIPETITSELVYYWMDECNINKECETWHLNRLLRLIEITSIKRQPEKKMGKKNTIAQNKALNATRRARMGSKG